MPARRITGRHLLIDGPGAIAEVAQSDAARVAARLHSAVAAIDGVVGPVLRHHAQGATVALGSPGDVVDAACDLLDWALDDDGDEALEAIARRAARLHEPAYRALVRAFPEQVFHGEGLVTLGSGVFARSFPWDALPCPDDVRPVRDVPIVCVTGTNGKTTTTRLLAHFAESGGLRAGRSSSTGVYVGDQLIDTGDCTGPSAARTVLRHPAVRFAALETARGGLLRRGLVRDGIWAAVLTNVTQEHLGEWGVDDLEAMASAKLTIAAGLRRGGALIVPAPSERSAPIQPALQAFLRARPDVVVRTFGHSPEADAWADDTHLHVDGGHVPLAEIPLTIGGTARHNVENVLAATLAALAVGVPAGAISLGLRTLHPSVRENPGRLNRWRLPNGALVVVDFAHTPDGLVRVAETVRAWPRRRHTLLLGQAGDRPDADLRALAHAAIGLEPARFVVKDVTGRLYDRAPGEVPRVLREALLAGGVPARRILVRPDEVSGIREALRGAKPRDVVVLLIHETLAGAARELAAAGAVEVEG